MSMRGRSRCAHLVTRGRSRQEPEIAAPRARGHSPLEANLRMRNRGNGRSPLRPAGVPSPTPSLSRDAKAPGLDGLGRTSAAVQPVKLPMENGGSGDGQTGVLVFPEIVLPPAEEPVRGPLSWAYWSARRRQA